MNCERDYSCKKSRLSSHKLLSPQPVKSSYSSELNSSFGNLSPALTGQSMMEQNVSIFSPNCSPCKKLFSSPDTQPFYLDEIIRLRADSMNQLENEINRYESKTLDADIDGDLLLRQLEDDFANFPRNIFSN